MLHALEPSKFRTNIFVAELQPAYFDQASTAPHEVKKGSARQ